MWAAATLISQMETLTPPQLPTPTGVVFVPTTNLICFSLAKDGSRRPRLTACFLVFGVGTPLHSGFDVPHFAWYNRTTYFLESLFRRSGFLKRFFSVRYIRPAGVLRGRPGFFPSRFSGFL